MEQDLIRPRRRRRSPLLALCVVSPIVLVLGWTALWTLASREAGRAMDGWIATEAGHGRQWSCPDRRISGYPLQLRFDCRAPTLHATIGGASVDVAAAALTASTFLYQPTAVEASVVGPVQISTSVRETPAVLSWSSLTIGARIFIDGRGSAAIVIENAVADDAGVVSKAAHIAIRLAPTSGSSPEDASYDIAFHLVGGSVPDLDAMTGEAAALSVDGTAVLTHAVPAGAEAWQVLVERWRQDGGLCTLAASTIAKGALRLDAAGPLGLDPRHRLTGRLKTKTSAALLGLGLERLFAKGGVPFGLTLLLKTQISTPLADAPMVELPLAFGDGRVSVGPIPTSLRLAPLY